MLDKIDENTFVFTIVCPKYYPAKSSTEIDCFMTEDFTYCWDMDGTSFTSYEFGMIEEVYF